MRLAALGAIIAPRWGGSMSRREGGRADGRPTRRRPGKRLTATRASFSKSAFARSTAHGATTSPRPRHTRFPSLRSHAGEKFGSSHVRRC